MSDLKSVVARSTDSELSKAYAQLNTFEWPGRFAEHKPAGWDDMSPDERLSEHGSKTLWDLLMRHTSPFGRSRAWWIYKLNRTGDEHLEWWRTRV